MRYGHLRFFFFSREEARMHVHVSGPDGEAKIWLEPEIAPAGNWGLHDRDLRTALEVVREHEDVICDAWRRHFGG